MSIADLVKGIIHRQSPPVETVGTIADGPTVVVDPHSSHRVAVFRLDTNPNLEFRQELSPLSVEHRRGDRVRVQYQMDGAGVAQVNWMEVVDEGR